MKLEVTKKDLLLIKVAVTLLVVIACVRFLVMPALENIQTSKTALDEAEVQAEEWQYEIDSISSLETRRDTLTAQLAELAAPYYGSMESQEIDELVTGIALNHDLFPMNLSIGESATEVPAAYLYSESVMQTETVAEAAEEATTEDTTEDTEASDEDASTEDTSDTETTVTSTVGYLTQNAVSITVEGSNTNVMAFLDDLEENYPSIQVKSFTLSTGTYLNAQLEQIELTTMNCSLVVFTCDEQ